MRIALRSLAALLLLSTSAVSADRRDVTIQSGDGTGVRATYYSPGKPGPGIMLFHQCGDDTSRKNWESLAPRLAEAGFHVLTYDEPGFGESPGEPMPKIGIKMMEYWRTKWSTPMEAAYRYLESQAGVDKANLGVGGASCGVYMSLLLAQSHANEVKTLVLLSGPLDEAAMTFVRKSAAVPIFAAASVEDTETFRSMKGVGNVEEVVKISTNPKSQYRSYKGAGHGTEMFDHVPELEPAIVEWFKKTLKSHDAIRLKN